ncbi:GlsB/YeaQ/YmgE family stress response membrane protein [Palleronia marisminoris]|uniref:Uncharacterized protein n=1 Tax=Palleronia marisminoris TaxID=315423 RepID=A0A1Y5SAS3_9RHOB|nr:GlsB/YeaQ/YmgE family stress response membrane protein [Palleronia marisminoris]SLN33512.1 hypothetical protein PAM7066_01365 [Palleronia marisminoris]
MKLAIILAIIGAIIGIFFGVSMGVTTGGSGYGGELFFGPIGAVIGFLGGWAIRR